jgi:hypothetical protein
MCVKKRRDCGYAKWDNKWSYWEQFEGHTKIVKTFRMLLGTFGGTKALDPKKNLQRLQDPIHKRRLGMHDHCDNLPITS